MAPIFQLDPGPLVAESGPYFRRIFGFKSVRFEEKRTLSLRFLKSDRNASALSSEADIQQER